MTIKVIIWNEYRYEQSHEEVRRMYPNGLHAPIADHLSSDGIKMRVAPVDEPKHGLTEMVLADIIP